MSKRPLLISTALTLAFAAWLWHAGLLAQWQQSFQRVPLLWWGVMVAGMMLSYGLRAWRIRGEFCDVPGMRGWLALRIVLTHTALVNVLPMRSGELGFPWLMHRTLNVGWLDASASLLWLRLQDAMVLAVLAVWAWPGLALPARAAMTLALGLAAWAGVRWVRRHGLDGTGSAGLLKRLTQALTRRGHRLWQGWAITLINWSLKLSLQAWLLAQWVEHNWAVGWAGALGAELSALLPVQGLGGVGGFEVGSAAAMHWHGVPWIDGLQAALTLHLVLLSCSVGFGLLAWWLPRPLVARHNGV